MFYRLLVYVLGFVALIFIAGLLLFAAFVVVISLGFWSVQGVVLRLFAFVDCCLWFRLPVWVF